MEQLAGELVDAVVRFDTATMDAIVELRGPILTKVLTSVTGLGSATAALVFVGLFALAGWDEEATQALAMLAVAGLVVGTLMVTVQRAFPARPVCLTDGAETVAHSFPSGHAAAVTGFAMVARDSETLPFGPAAALAAVIAFSRVYLGTHYLSDTLVGVAIGIGAFLLADSLLARVDLSVVTDRL
jgi:undecaprenyl-diphosphatase